MSIDPRTLDFAALGVLVTVAIVLIYAVIYIHDIPYEMAKKRNHPHRDAIHVAGWVSLFLMHTIWPFLWIWAYLYKPGEGWGAETVKVEPSDELKASLKKIEELDEKIKMLEAKVHHAAREVAAETGTEKNEGGAA